MTLLFILCLLHQDTVDDVIKAFSAESPVARGEAVDKVVARGRKAVPLLRDVIAKATGDAKGEATRAVARISEGEVRDLLKKEGHESLDAIKTVTHEVFAKAFPKATLYLLPGHAACKACGNVERIAVINDLEGDAKILKKSADVAALFTDKSKDEAAMRATAAAALFVLRAMNPKAHTAEVLPVKGEAFASPETLKRRKGDADAHVLTGELQVNHAFYNVDVTFAADGSLAGITLVDTGMR